MADNLCSCEVADDGGLSFSVHVEPPTGDALQYEVQQQQKENRHPAAVLTRTQRLQAQHKQVQQQAELRKQRSAAASPSDVRPTDHLGVCGEEGC